MTTTQTQPRTNEGSRPYAPSSGAARPRGQGAGGSSRGPGGSGGQFRGGRRSFRRGRRVCNFCVDKVNLIDYKAVNRLRRYVSDRARIDSSKKTGTCAKHQRMVRRAIAKARFMALLPYSPDHTRVTNMLAPRTPAETVEVDSADTSAEAGDGAPEGESTARAAEATAVDSAEQVNKAEEAEGAEDAKAAVSDAKVAVQEEAAPASAEASADVAQPEGETESADSEEAKV